MQPSEERLDIDIQGSTIKHSSGLNLISNFFNANFVGELAKPLRFQYKHFI